MSTRLQFTTDDGLSLHYRSWNAEGSSKAMVLLHRGHEHADRRDTVIPSLTMTDTAIYVWEARSHGPGLMRQMRDLDAFFHHLQKTHGLVPERTVVAHSVGAVFAAT